MTRHRLDRRFAGLKLRIGPLPDQGWVRALRAALGMSGFELAIRMGVHPSRIGQIERAELNGSIRMTTLARAAEALGSELLYVLVPKQELELMVWEQAFLKASEMIDDVTTDDRGWPIDDRELREAVRSEELAGLAYRLIDRRGLWRGTPPAPR